MNSAAILDTALGLVQVALVHMKSEETFYTPGLTLLVLSSYHTPMYNFVAQAFVPVLYNKLK